MRKQIWFVLLALYLAIILFQTTPVAEAETNVPGEEVVLVEGQSGTIPDDERGISVGILVLLVACDGISILWEVIHHEKK